MIEIQNLTKHFAATRVIDDLSLTIARGQTHVLLGSSGSGKTTLLRMIAGLTSIESGSIHFAGRDMREMNTRELSDQIGYVIQEGGLLPHLSAFENIMLPVRIRNLNFKAARDKAYELAANVELTSLQLDRFPHQLSGGQRQRVALIRGLILDQPIILLDEPLSALDPIVRLNLQQHLKGLFTKLDKTVVLVTHDLNVASFLGDEISLMSHGRIVQQGRYHDLVNSPANDFVFDFIRAHSPHQEVMA